MPWFRRRTPERRSTELVPTAERTAEVALRTERAVYALAVHAKHLSERVESLECRLTDVLDRAQESVSHDELLEVRIHSAKTAAECSRLAVNLRAQIDAVKAALPTERDQRLNTMAETIIELSDGLDTTDDDVERGRRSGDETTGQTTWARTA